MTDEEIEAEGREEARRERYERRYGPEPEPWADCDYCGAGVDPDEGVGCEGGVESCSAVLHEDCAVAMIPEDGTYLCRRHARIDLAPLNAKLDAEPRERRIPISCRKGGCDCAAEGLPITHFRDCAAHLHARALLAALAALPAKEISQWGGAVHFVYSVWDCRVQHGDLIVRASKVAAELIGSLIARGYTDAWRAERSSPNIGEARK